MPTTEALIAARLDAIAEAHPSLRPLRAMLGPDLALTRPFSDAYRAHPAPAAVRSQLLRVLLADPSLVPPEAAVVTGPLLRRIVAWLDLADLLDGSGYARDPIPKSVFTLFGEPRSSVHAFTRNIALRPWWCLQTTGVPDHPALARLSSDDLRPLSTVVARRTLSSDKARAMASLSGALSTTRAKWFFSTGCAPLDLRNALVYLDIVLGDRSGGKAQNKLPVALTDRWSLPRLSLPHALLFCDVAALSANHLLRQDKLAHDALGLQPALAGPAHSLLANGDDDIRNALQRHLSRTILGPAEARRRRDLLDRRSKDGVFDTGAAVNISRLVSMPAFASFATYYGSMDMKGLAHLACRIWGNDGAPAWAHSLLGYAASAAQYRDLGNVMAYLSFLGVDLADRAAVWRSLPSVARFALGAKEAHSSSSSRGRAAKYGRQQSPRPGALPRLDELATLDAPTAYVLSPGYQGPLPQDGSLFVHAAVAAGFVCPPQAQIIGSAPLPWDVDPIAAAKEQLVEAGWRSVSVLD